MTQLHYEDVSEGMALPPLVKETYKPMVLVV